MGNDILFFPITITVEDELGQKETIEDYSRQVFCEKKSVTRQEFFAAGQSGLQPQVMLLVNLFDYEDEKKLKFNNKTFHIYRTYERSDERIELYCEVKTGG